MIILLIAWQLTSTNCIPDYTGGMNCTTISTPPPQSLPQPPALIQAPPIPESNHCALCNIISIFEGDANKRHAKAVGNMLAKGDCSRAEKYALENGDLDLADRVRAYCASKPSADSDWDFAREGMLRAQREQSNPPLNPDPR